MMTSHANASVAWTLGGAAGGIGAEVDTARYAHRVTVRSWRAAAQRSTRTLRRFAPGLAQRSAKPRRPISCGAKVALFACVLLLAVGVGCWSDTRPHHPNGASALPTDHGLGVICTSDSDCLEGLTCPPRPIGAERYCAEEGFQYVSPGSVELTAHRPVSESTLAGELVYATLTRAFLFQTHEVTQGEWLDIMGSNPSRFQDCGLDCPVEMVSWIEAAMYANERSVRAGLSPCYEEDGSVREGGSVYDCAGYRLPTEAEWLFADGACRAEIGVDSRDVERFDAISWHRRNSGGRTHPVGGKKPNDLGLHDMRGNVSEWMHDRFERSTVVLPVTDPEGAPVGSFRVVRGVSVTTGPTWGRNFLFARGVLWRGESLGFRLARTVPHFD